MSRVRRAKPDTGKGKASCRVSGKIKFSTEKAALGASNVTGKVFDKELYYYKCPYCRDFHLTKSVQHGKG